MTASDRELEKVETADPEVLSSGLLSSYDRLRLRLVLAVERKGRLGKAVSEPLMLAPDLLVLLVRLCLDRDVSPASRQLIVGALAYFLTPVDLLPEAFLGVGGILDDVVLVSLVLSHSLDAELEVERSSTGAVVRNFESSWQMLRRRGRRCSGSMYTSD